MNKVIKLVIISDTHTQHRQLTKMPEGDILVHCGDWTYNGGMSEIGRLNHWFSDLIEAGVYKHVVVIPGNHDLTVEYNQTLVRHMLSSCTMLINEGCEIMGLKFWGSPVTPKFCDWAFMMDEEDREKVFADVPDNLDVLITHGPPYGVLDQPFGQVDKHVGCKMLLNAVQDKQPRIHCFGHIHGSPGMVQVDGIDTLFINATVVNEKYKVVNAPIEIEYTIEEGDSNGSDDTHSE